MEYTIKKIDIQNNCKSIYFYKNGILEFEKIETDFNKEGMAILCNSWIAGGLDDE